MDGKSTILQRSRARADVRSLPNRKERRRRRAGTGARAKPKVR